MRDKGAHFYRCDFQVHTPRDANWRGADAVTEEERQELARRLVAACRVKGLDAIAITDHHDFVTYPFVREAAASELDSDGKALPPEQRLVIFPGLELTLGVPCQALLILDADMPLDRLSLVLEALAVDPVDPAVSRIPNVARIDRIQTFDALCQELDARTWLRGRYIVLPNVTDGGYGSLMRQHMQAKYKSMPCVGGYLDGTVETKVGAGNRRIFDGLDAAWGNKRIALFQTSDSRHESFQELGKHSTWVKWATPTAEAIRQACLSQESRISQQTPAAPTVFVSRLTVSNSKFLGPVDLQLNRQYNALIGGRGTGKSTLLDYLRWGLCDEPPSVADEEVANPAARRQRLVADTLAPFDATVEVHFTVNEIAHVVRRHSESGEVQLRVGKGDFDRTREADIRSLLPIHAYSQKQLSSVAVRVDELRRFIVAPINVRLGVIDRRIGELGSEIRESYATLRRAFNLDMGIANTMLAEQSLSEQAKSLRLSLRGLSDADKSLLAEKSWHDDAAGVLERFDGGHERTLEWTRDLRARVARDRDGVRMLDGGPAQLRDAVGKLQAELKKVQDELLADIEAGLTKAEQRLSDTSTYGVLRAGVVRIIGNFEASYEDVKARSTDHEAKLAALADVEEKLKDISNVLREQRVERNGLGDARAAHEQLRRTLKGLREERSSVVEEQCVEVTRLSGGLLRATLQRAQGFAAIESRLRGLLSGTGLRTAKLDGFFAALRSESNPDATWQAVLGELERLVDVDDDANLTSETTPTLSRLGLVVADQRRLATKLTPDAWLDLLLTGTSDEPSFEYQTKEGEYMEFARASSGQQATALLQVLLAQSGMPLLIDQPEEDLDSQIIQDVVTRLWIAKGNRQVIFASHNANLVVNGDAELVVVCDYRSVGDQSVGQIKTEGAIDVTEVREEITHIMEGGERAFRLRKEKYGF